MMNSVYLGDFLVSAIFIGDTPTLYGYDLENDRVSRYIALTDYSNDPDYTYTDIDQYIQNMGTVKYYEPRPVIISWGVGVYTSITIDISTSNDFSQEVFTYTAQSSTTSIMIYNLIPSKLYYYRVKDGNTVVKSGAFKTSGKVRMLRIPNCRNFRDIGGWDCGNNKKIAYGKIIRGIEVDESGMAITADGITELVDRVGITTEIDFSSHSDSPLIQYGVELYYNQALYGIGAYNNVKTEEHPDIIESFTSTEGRLKYNNVLSLIIEKLLNNKVLYVHCNAGCDRTGTLCFLIEALLGMNESDLAKEYELSSFYSQRTRTGYIGGYAPGTVTDYNYKTMIMWIRDNYSGSTINEKVYNLCTQSEANNGIGLTAAQVESLRSVMLVNN